MCFYINNTDNVKYNILSESKRKENTLNSDKVSNTEETIKKELIAVTDFPKSKAKISNDFKTLYKEELTSDINTIKKFNIDTLTDQEEGKIISIIKEAKEKGQLNNLIDMLSTDNKGDKTLLDKVINKWDEEIINYNPPGIIDKVVSWYKGEKLPEKPVNNNTFTDLLNEVFTDKTLSKSSAEKLVLSINKVYEPNNSEVTYGLQSNINRVIKNLPLSSFSKGTLEVFRESMTPLKGNDSQMLWINEGRKKLGIKTNP